MGLFDQFPYTNFHNLNLDWIIGQIKSIKSAVTSTAEDAASASHSAEAAAASAGSAAGSAAYAGNAAALVQQVRDDLDTVNTEMTNFVQAHSGLYNETVLWSGTASATGDTITLSDDIRNYKYIDVQATYKGAVSASAFGTFSSNVVRFTPEMFTDDNAVLNIPYAYNDQLQICTVFMFWDSLDPTDYTKISLGYSRRVSINDHGDLDNAADPGTVIVKIVGVKNIADAEVIDARVGEDDTVYSTLKQRLDTEYSDLKSAIGDLDSLEQTVYEIDNLVSSSGSGEETINYATILEVGAIGSNGSNVTDAWTNEQSCRTNDYIDISGAEKVGFTITRKSGTTPGQGGDGSFYNYLFFYTDAKALISRVGGANQDEVLTAVPQNAKYARVSFSFTALTSVSSYSIFGTVHTTSSPHPIVDAVLGLLSGSGVHVPNNGLIMGDSISFGMYSYWDGTKRKNADDLYSDINQTASDPRISDYFAEYFGIEIENVAKRGTGWVADTRNLGNAWVKAQAIDFSEYGFVGLCYGVNDWIQSESIGTISENTVGTVIGNMIHTITKIYTDNPLCKVVVFSPLNTWGQWRDTTGELQTLYGDADTHYALGATNSAGYTLQQLIDAMESVCNRYDIRHVVMSQGCTINAINIKDILIDGLHPSKESMKSIASDMFHTMLFK